MVLSQSDASVYGGAAKAAGAGLFIGISNIYPDCPDALKAAEHLLPDLSGLPSLLAERAA